MIYFGFLVGLFILGVISSGFSFNDHNSEQVIAFAQLSITGFAVVAAAMVFVHFYYDMPRTYLVKTINEKSRLSRMIQIRHILKKER